MKVSSLIYESMFLFRFSFASISTLCLSAKPHNDICYTMISGLMSKIRSWQGVDESLNRSAARFLRWLGSSWRDCTKGVHQPNSPIAFSPGRVSTSTSKPRITMIMWQRNGIRKLCAARFRRWRWPRWCRGVRSLLSREIYPD